MKIKTSLWAYLGLMVARVVADVSSFSYPPASDDPNSTDFSDNLTFSIDDSITVKWNSSFERVSMLLEQKDNNFRPVLIDNEANPKSLNWTVSYNDFGDQLNSNSMMRFLLYQAPTQNHVYSHFFNLSSAPDLSSIAPETTPPTVVVPVTTSSTPTKQSTLATSVSASATPTSTSAIAAQAVDMSASLTSAAATPSATSQGLDPSTQAGLGVGLGVGIPLLGLMGGIIYLLTRRSKARSNDTLPPYEFQHPGGPYRSMSTMSSFPSRTPNHGLASQPDMHAVPILQAPPPAKYIAHHHPTNSDGYAPPSAKLKPWPENQLRNGGDEEYETKRMDAYGRSKGPMVLNEAPGDYGSYGPAEMDARSWADAKELPALPLTPTEETRKQREWSEEEEAARLRKLIGG